MSKANKLITVVTVVYNAGNVIEKTIQSIVNQTLFDRVEYIVIDGNSKDNTLEIINKYKDKIDILVSEPDNGIYDAMNKAIALANGEWINFMNAGDLFSDSKVLENIFKNNLTGYDFIYGSHYWKTQKGKLNHVESNTLETMWQRIAFSHQTLFSKTKLMKEHKFNLSYDIVSDYEFYFHHYMNGYKFFNANIPIATVLAGGFSDNNFMRRTIERWAVVVKYKDEPQVHSFYLNLIEQHRKNNKQRVLPVKKEATVDTEKYKISIIIPNYNNVEYLDDCFESISKQSHKNIEIIVVDDCSTDGSREKLENYAKQYEFIKLIFNQTNQGVAKNRDKAIKQSTGEYITTLDSDDYYIDKDKLKKELELVLKYKKEKGQDIIAFSNILLVNADKSKIGYQMDKKIAQGDVFGAIFGRGCMIPRDFLFTKQMYQNIGGFDFDIPIYEDWDLKIRFASKYKFYHVNIDGIGYRRHGQGLSSAGQQEHQKWLKHIVLKNFHLIIDRKDKIQLASKLEKFIK